MSALDEANAANEEAPLLAMREEFPTLQKGVHLISHSLGAMPRNARKYTTQFLDEWENDSINAWHAWLPAVRSLSDIIASVIGVKPGSVVILPNVSIVQSVVASCFDFADSGRASSLHAKPRNKIVYDELNFSTVHYVWQEQVRRGARLSVVKSKDGIHAPIEELLAAIDEETLIVPISHVLFRSSAMFDAKRVIDRAHEVGALVMLDCYQSAAAVPLELEKWNCDIACGGSVKWACGGPGAAYLYVRPDLLPKMKPMSTGWFAHAQPFAFDMGAMKYAEDIWRMIGGTPAIPAIYSARAGWEIIQKVGVENVRKKSLRQTALLRSKVEERGFTVNTPKNDDERGGTICFDFPGADVISKALCEQKFFHDYRPKCGIRVSPHFYTTDAELDSFLGALDEALDAERAKSS